MRKLVLAGILVASPLAADEAADQAVIAMLGDSLTAGYGLAPDAGLVPVLERWLQAQGAQVRLINAGVSGDTTAGGLARIDWTLTPEVEGLVVALGANDLLRGLDPAAARTNLRGILEAGRDAGVAILVVGVPAPLNYGADYKAEFDAIYPDLAQEFGALYVEDLLAPMQEATADGTRLETFLQPDRLHPNPAGLELIVAGLGPQMLALVVRIAQ
ncbi:Arylesterase precursor [Candidatus Rhodobacter oscarellae]|uniref:Arylesterase n=2 Tax=Candidatus Rhodobacter oscarellae TaxID=1675527 RepID=A0A0J9GXA7_9RHOB|nr:Arylesterase precursor [Candidatus Rhodobacter lobularis]